MVHYHTAQLILVTHSVVISDDGVTPLHRGATIIQS